MSLAAGSGPSGAPNSNVSRPGKSYAVTEGPMRVKAIYGLLR